MSALFGLGLKNLRRNRRRNLLTGGAILLGCTAIVVTLGFVLGVERHLRTTSVYLAYNGHVVVYHRGGLERFRADPAHFALDVAAQKAIFAAAAADPDVAFAGAFLRGSGLIGNGCKSLPFLGIAVDPEVERRIRANAAVQAVAGPLLRLSTGRELWEAAAVPGALALSRGLARRLGKEAVDSAASSPSPTIMPGDCGTSAAASLIAADPNVQLAANAFDGGFSAVDGEIVRIFSTGLQELEPTFVVGQLQAWQKQLYDTDAVTQVGLFLKDGSDAVRKATAWESTLRARGLDVSVYPWTDRRISPLYAGTMRFLRVTIGFVSVVIVLLVVLSVVNAATMTVVERSREVGTLRAIGYTPWAVATVFGDEAMTLGGIAASAGVALAAVIAAVLDQAAVQFKLPGTVGPVQLAVLLPPAACIGTVAGLTAVAFSTAFLVALRRARRETAELLTT